jgi:hypothetical protein
MKWHLPLLAFIWEVRNEKAFDPFGLVIGKTKVALYAISLFRSPTAFRG